MSASQPAVTRAVPTGSPLDAWRGVLGVALVAGAVVIYLCVVGIVPIFGERPLVDEVVTLGEAALLITGVASGYVAAQRAPAGTIGAIGGGVLAGLIAGAFLAVLILLSAAFALRSFLPNVSPDLLDILTFDSDPAVNGFWMPLLGGAALGLLGAILVVLPSVLRGLIVVNLVALFAMGLFAGLVRTPMLSGLLANEARTVFASDGLTREGALVTVVVASAAYVAWVGLRVRQRVRAMPDQQRRVAAIPVSVVLLMVILWLPLGMGPFVAQAVALIALYILMGLGLNITLGLAGLLDLGFVAFFAVGAYTVALLTSTGPFGLTDISFWFAVPFAIIAAMAFGVFLGLPILGIRGDYLAIATLGFRRDHRHPRQVRPAEALARRPAGHPQHPAAHRRRGHRLPERSGADLLHRAGLRGGRRLRGLSPAGIATRARMAGDPRGRGRCRGARRQPRPDQDPGLHAWRRLRWPRRGHLRQLHRLGLPEQHQHLRVDQRGRHRHRRRHGQHPRCGAGRHRPHRAARALP